MTASPSSDRMGWSPESRSMIFNRAAPNDTRFDSKTPCWSGPRCMSVWMALCMRPGPGANLSLVNPATPHKIHFPPNRRRAPRRTFQLYHVGMTVTAVFLGVAGIPFVYYLFFLYSAWGFFLLR